MINYACCYNILNKNENFNNTVFCQTLFVSQNIIKIVSIQAVVAIETSLKLYKYSILINEIKIFDVSLCKNNSHDPKIFK
jgi:hypothetical protein